MREARTWKQREAFIQAHIDELDELKRACVLKHGMLHSAMERADELIADADKWLGRGEFGMATAFCNRAADEIAARRKDAKLC
jgi:hypothetical protein